MANSLKEKQQQIKRINTYYIIILILCLIITIIGITLAYYSLLGSEKKDATQISTGTLVASFEDGIEINSPYFIPRHKPTSLNDNQYLYTNKLKIENTGTLNQVFDLYLTININEFKNNSLKYIIYNTNGNQVKDGNIIKSGEMKLLESTYLKTNDKAEYTLAIWLEENNQNQNDEQAKKLNGTLRVEAIQSKN